MRVFLPLCVVTIVTILSSEMVVAQSSLQQKPATQEQLDEQELEAVYGVDVERDRLNRNAIQTTTRDRYGDGRVAVFQDNTQSARNLETNDTIGLELKLFEFK